MVTILGDRQSGAIGNPWKQAMVDRKAYCEPTRLVEEAITSDRQRPGEWQSRGDGSHGGQRMVDVRTTWGQRLFWGQIFLTGKSREVP